MLQKRVFLEKAERKFTCLECHQKERFAFSGTFFCIGLNCNAADSYICFWLVLFQSVPYFFFLYQSPWLCMVFDAISSNIYDFPLINRYAVFVFGDFNIHHKDWLTYSGGTDGPGKLYYNFSLLNDLTLMLNFPTRIAQCNPESTLLDLFISVLRWLSLYWKVLIKLVS